MNMNAVQLLEPTFDQAIVVVDFQATWCGPCKVMAPLVHELKEEITSARFVEVDVDANPELASAFSVQSIPTFIIARDGIVVDRITGALAKSALREKILAQVTKLATV
jgi:thioredoxin 1